MTPMQIVLELLKSLKVDVNYQLFMDSEKNEMRIIVELARQCPHLTFEEIYSKMYDIQGSN